MCATYCIINHQIQTRPHATRNCIAIWWKWIPLYSLRQLIVIVYSKIGHEIMLFHFPLLPLSWSQLKIHHKIVCDRSHEIMLFHLQLLSLLTIPTEHMPQVTIKQDCMRCVLSFLQEFTCIVLCAVFLSLLFLFCSFISLDLPPILLIFCLTHSNFCTALHEKLHELVYYCSFDSFLVTFLYIPPANNGINLQTTERKQIAQHIAGKVRPTLKQKAI